MAPLFAIIRYALLETFFCIPILPKTDLYPILKKTVWSVQVQVAVVIFTLVV